MWVNKWTTRTLLPKQVCSHLGLGFGIARVPLSIKMSGYHRKSKLTHSVVFGGLKRRSFLLTHVNTNACAPHCVSSLSRRRRALGQSHRGLHRRLRGVQARHLLLMDVCPTGHVSAKLHINFVTRDKLKKSFMFVRVCCCEEMMLTRDCQRKNKGCSGIQLKLYYREIIFILWLISCD